MKKKLSFSGHDKFYCRQFWLKKGLAHVEENKAFNSQAVIDLGVGRNMVTAVRYWINAFGVVVEDTPTELGKTLLSDEGLDPYIEDIGTLWLLHYSLVVTGKASIYSIIFNDFLQQRIEFTKEDLFKYIITYCEKQKIYVNSGSLNHDINVFISNYTLAENKKGIEAKFNGLLYELKLLRNISKSSREVWYRVENGERAALHPAILLFCLLYNDEERRIYSFNDLMNKDYSVGRIFCLSPNALYDKINQLTELYPNELLFTEDAGVKVLQIKGNLNAWQVLKDYYEN